MLGRLTHLPGLLTGCRRLLDRHPAVGPLELVYHTVDLAPAGEARLAMTVYTAEPGTPSEDGLKLLASWAATSGQARSSDRV